MKLIIYWSNKIRNLIFIILSSALLSQDGEILEITKHIGYTLDAEENLHYKVFNDIPNFESAQFFEISSQKIEARISFVEYTNIKTSRRAFDLKEFSNIQFRLKKTPNITDEIRQSFRKNLTYLRTKSILENIPKLSVAQAYYQRNNDKNPFDFNNPSINTVFGYKLGYEVSQGVSLIWDFRQFYRDTGTGLKPIKQTTIETAFNF